MNHSSTEEHGAKQPSIYIRWRGRMSGPFSTEIVLRMLNQNQITKHHEVSEDRVHWRPLAKTDMLTPTSPQKSESPVEDLQNEYLIDEATGKNDIPDPSLISSSAESRNTRITLDTITDDSTIGIHRPVSDVKNAKAQHLSGLFSQIIFYAKSMPWIFGFGIVPLVIGFLHLRFAQSTWLFSAYFCVLWAWIIGSLVDRHRRNWQQGIFYSVFTTFIGSAMLLAWCNIPVIGRLYYGASMSGPSDSLAGWILGVGLLEELCKVAPLILFGLRATIMHSPADGLFLGMMSGLGFAMSEGVIYTLDYWSNAVGISAVSISQCVDQASNLSGIVDPDVFREQLTMILPGLFQQYGHLLVAQFIRFMALPVLHAAWAGLVGYALARAFLMGEWGVLFIGLGIAAVLHGLYNFNCSAMQGGYSLLVAVLSLLLVFGLSVRENLFNKANAQ